MAGIRGEQNQRLHYTAVVSGGQSHLRKKASAHEAVHAREDKSDSPDFSIPSSLIRLLRF